MSFSPQVSMDKISPRIYSKLPSIKQKENENIIYSDHNEIMQTAYQEHYTVKDFGEKSIPFKPINQLEISKDNFTGQSCYHDEFISKTVDKVKSLKPLQSYAVPCEGINLCTNYEMEFNEKKGERIGLIKPQNRFVPPNDFHEQQSSNYQLEFGQKNCEKTKTCRPEYIYKPTEQMDKFQSSYQTEFLEGSSSPTRSYKPKHLIQMPTGPLEKCTSYSTEFNYLKSTSPTKNYKPKRTFEMPTEPFNTNTSYSTEFNQLKSSSPTRNYRPKCTFEMPTEPLETNTSYNTQFTISESSSPTKPIRPDRSFRPSNIPFHPSTSYQDDYLETNEKTIKLPSFKPKAEYKSPREPIDTVTTYSYDFHNEIKSLERPQSFKPTSSYNLPTTSMDIQSSYKLDFKTNKLSPRLYPIKPVNQIQLHQDQTELKIDVNRQNPYQNSIETQKPNPIVREKNYRKISEHQMHNHFEELQLNNVSENVSFPKVNTANLKTENSFHVNSFSNDASKQ